MYTVFVLLIAIESTGMSLSIDSIPFECCISRAGPSCSGQSSQQRESREWPVSDCAFLISHSILPCKGRDSAPEYAVSAISRSYWFNLDYYCKVNRLPWPRDSTVSIPPILKLNLLILQLHVREASQLPPPSPSFIVASGNRAACLSCWIYLYRLF